MPSKNINHAAAWVGAIVFFIWGYIWYGILFKGQVTQYMAQSGFHPDPSDFKPYVVAFLMALLLSYGTAIALAKSDEHTAAHGISFGLFMGVIFYAGITLIQVFFAGSPLGLWLINVGWALIGFALVGAIVGGWPRRAAA